MLDKLAGILGFIIFVSIILSGLADIILSVTWTKRYFTSGVLIFSQSTPISKRYTDIPSADFINKRLYSFWIGGFTLKELDANTHGFRREFFSRRFFRFRFNSNPMTHGVVIFDAHQNLVTVKGYLDWFMVTCIAGLVVVPFMLLIAGTVFAPKLALRASGYILGYILFSCLITGILYLIDYYRLKNILATAVELWSRKYGTA
jgi:hypothetical protein